MDQLHQVLAPLAAYPRWLVITCLVLVGIAALWVLAKVMKFTIYLVLLALVVVAVLVAFGWIMG